MLLGSGACAAESAPALVERRAMKLLLTHGYFLMEDPKEQRIMKPYAPLGILSSRRICGIRALT